MTGAHRVEPGAKVKLSAIDPAARGGVRDKAKAEAETLANIRQIDELSFRLFAENRRALLIVLQGMDTSGKDGVIRRVLGGVSPQRCQVTSFSVPSALELDHDFLWRIHLAVPKRGDIGIFNRSHYEDVLVVRVRELAPEKEWRGRYGRINEFERLLTEGGTTILKFFLHISRDEQRKRLQERIDDPTKLWKFDSADLAARKSWNAYRAAYEEAISRCSTKHAPWHIVPADRKWHRDLVISRVVRDTLSAMKPKYPPPDPNFRGLKIK